MKKLLFTPVLAIVFLSGCRCFDRYDDRDDLPRLRDRDRDRYDDRDRDRYERERFERDRFDRERDRDQDRYERDRYDRDRGDRVRDRERERIRDSRDDVNNRFNDEFNTDWGRAGGWHWYGADRRLPPFNPPDVRTPPINEVYPPRAEDPTWRNR
jgi:hypothetical protein